MLRVLRPKQWSKNLLIFAALLFTRSYLDSVLVSLALWAFVAMCMVSSATYIANDLKDAERDRSHPIKKNRPIASGSLSVAFAVVLCLVLLGGGLAVGYFISTSVLAILLTYVGLQVLYNAGLKRIPVTDVFILSLGFVLRAALGAAAISVTISGWLLFCTGALALLLGFGKRRHEFVLQGDSRSVSRESLGSYTKPGLDALVLMSATGAAMCYGIYSVESPTAKQYPALILTSLFVFYGICRYVFLVFSREEGGEPENLLFKDVHLLISIFGFLASAVLALSGFTIPLLEGPR